MSNTPFPIPSGVAGSWNLLDIQSGILTTSIDFVVGIDDTYDMYAFTLTNLLPDTTSALFIRFSSDGGISYIDAADSYLWSATSVIENGNQVATVSTNAGTPNINPTGNNNINITASGINGVHYLSSPSDNTSVCSMFGLSEIANTAGLYRVFNFAGSLRTDLSAINAVRFIMETGSFQTGTVRLYGISNN